MKFLFINKFSLQLLLCEKCCTFIPCLQYPGPAKMRKELSQVLSAANKISLKLKVLEEHRYGLIQLCFMPKLRCFELFRCPDVMFPGHPDARLGSMKQDHMLKGQTSSRPWRRQISSLCFAVLLPDTLCIAEPTLSCQNVSVDWDELGRPSVQSIPSSRHLYLGIVTLMSVEKPAGLGFVSFFIAGQVDQEFTLTF